MRDLIFYGGPIVTMKTEEMPEAVLVRKGRILFVGSLSQARALADDAACIDLAGRALLPAFIDPHSHITALAQTLRLVDLHSATSFAQIQQLIREFSVRFAPAPGDWICGFGYDHNFLAEKRHPDRALLDTVCPETPLLIAHSSGHMGVANSAALHALGIGPQTPDPEGGRIGREADGKTPNGYLEETAFTANSAKIPAPSLEQQLKGICQAQQIYFLTGSPRFRRVSHGQTAGSCSRPRRIAVYCRGMLSAISICSSAARWRSGMSPGANTGSIFGSAATRSSSTGRHRGAPPGSANPISEMAPIIGVIQPIRMQRWNSL